MLNSWKITPGAPNYPNNALHVYRFNVDVNMQNRDMYAKCFGACNARAGQH